MTHFDGNAIKHLRWSLNLSQRELAEKLQVSQAAVAHWERGLKKPGRKNRKQIEELLSVVDLSPEAAWQSRRPLFKIANDNDIYTIDLGGNGVKLVPMIHIYISPVIPPLIEDSDKESWSHNSEYQRYLGCFREECDSLELKVGEDYDFGAVDQHVDITPLNQSAWKKLQPWDLDNEEIVRFWLNRK